MVLCVIVEDLDVRLPSHWSEIYSLLLIFMVYLQH